MHFLSSVLLTVGVGLGALGMLAMTTGAVCATLIEAARDGPLTPPPTGRGSS
jgi:hypothetical protein